MSDGRQSDPAAGDRRATGELVVVTGPSHVGKSTLISALVELINRPAEIVSIDEVIEASDLPPELRWERGLEAAYDAAAAQTSEALAGNCLVLYESTFTYVPPDSRPAQLHPEQLQRLLNVAEEHDSDALVVYLTASLDAVERRQEQTARLTGRIVSEAWRMHAEAALEATRWLRLDTSKISAQEAATVVLSRIGG